MNNEPQTIEDAHKRLATLKREVVAIQNAVGDRDVRRADGFRMNDREWWIWKKSKVVELEAKLAELGEMKTFIFVNEKNLKRQVKGETGPMVDACNELKSLVKKVTSNAWAMERRIEELTAENNALHKRLQALELQNTNPLPDNGREGWRQDDNVDKEPTTISAIGE